MVFVVDLISCGGGSLLNGKRHAADWEIASCDDLSISLIAVRGQGVYLDRYNIEQGTGIFVLCYSVFISVTLSFRLF